jgi:hypothetical protein
MRILLFLYSVGMLTACVNDIQEKEQKTEHKLSDSEIVLYHSWRNTQCYYDEPPFGTFLVNRNDTFQEEFIKVNGMIVEFDVSWQNDSAYTMKFKKVAENPQKISLPNGMDTLVRTCWMTQVTELSYIEAATSNLMTNKDTIYTKYKRPEKKLGPLR